MTGRPAGVNSSRALESGLPLNDRANGCAGRMPEAIDSPREREKEKAARK
jgi:hypothetical protein